MKARNFEGFRRKVRRWKSGSAAAGEIVKVLGIKDRNIRITIRNNYNEIHSKLLDFINIREQGKVKGAAKGQQTKRDRLINIFTNTVNDVNNADWPDLTEAFNKVYRRKSKKDINNFMEILGEEGKKIIYVNSPEDWPLKPYFEIKLTYEDDAQEDESGNLP